VGRKRRPAPATPPELTWSVLNDEATLALRRLQQNTLDSLVSDPPAGIGFMGKDWDGTNERAAFVAWLTPIMAEALRVLKPGAHGLVWALPRTSHWTAWALECAGFEVLDVVTHLFGSGFPKSLDAAKALDKAGGVKPTGRRKATLGLGPQWNALHTQLVMPPTTSAAGKRWQGWGTRLKPASEHWLLVRKPLSEGTVAANLTAWGVGAINVDACRVACEGGSPSARRRASPRASKQGQPGFVDSSPERYAEKRPGEALGRCPANLILDAEAGAMLDAQSGTLTSGTGAVKRATSDGHRGPTLGAESRPEGTEMLSYGDSGGASRFFYCSKPARREKEAGCDELEALGPERLTKRKRGSAGLVMKHASGKAKANPYAGTSGHGEVLDNTEVVSVEPVRQVNGSWENAGPKVVLRVDTGPSRPRVTAVCEPSRKAGSAASWNTFLFGKSETARSLAEGRFTTSTKTSWTTDSKTLSWLTRSLTNASTADASCATACGGNRVGSVAFSRALILTTTDGSQASLPGANGAASALRVTASAAFAGRRNIHPTIKPVRLMRYLVRMVTPPGGTVLDPFAGSGTTGVAAVLEGARFIGMELDARYTETARARIKHADGNASLAASTAP